MTTEIEKANTAEGLPTALDIAEAKTQYDETPSTTALFRWLNGEVKHAPPETLRDGQRIVANPGTVAAVLFDMALPLFTDEDLAKARDMQAWFLASIKKDEPYGLNNVTAHQHRQRDEIEAKTAAGESTDGLVMESRETVARTFLAHLNAGQKERIRKFNAEVRPLCEAALKKFWTALEDYMRNVERQDRLECAGFGLPHYASIRWQACAHIAVCYKPEHRLRSGSWATPGDILAGLIDL